MFSRLFRSKKPYTAVETPAASLRFLGEPTGDAVGVLERELTRILEAEGNASKAFLRRVQYPGEERIRLALIVDGDAPAEKMAPVIARACQPLVAIDIIFFASLKAGHIDEVRNGGPPFYGPPDA
jgi:hypothetical protein